MAVTLRIPFIIVLVFFLQKGLTQSSAADNLLSYRDTLLLFVENGQKYVLHAVKPGQTLFGIAKYYSLGFEDLYRYNPELQTATVLHVGQLLRIPIPNLAIHRYKTKSFKAKDNIPIYYVVQRGDNLYNICKRYFSMPVDTIMRRNGLNGSGLQPGQLLLMGWMPASGISDEWRPEGGGLAPEAMGQLYTQQQTGKNVYEAQGVCFWHRDSKESGNLYALHNEAAIGTVMAVFNPMSGRTVHAKVIGRIPAGYARNTEVILSPEAARTLGAKDPRFFVKIKFLK